MVFVATDAVAYVDIGQRVTTDEEALGLAKVEVKSKSCFVFGNGRYVYFHANGKPNEEHYGNRGMYSLSAKRMWQLLKNARGESFVYTSPKRPVGWREAVDDGHPERIGKFVSQKKTIRLSSNMLKAEVPMLGCDFDYLKRHSVRLAMKTVCRLPALKPTPYVGETRSGKVIPLPYASNTVEVVLFWRNGR
ncbi:MAG: hypothetical protein ABSB29_04395 [Nitrososphaerales archaeon]